MNHATITLLLVTLLPLGCESVPELKRQLVVSVQGPDQPLERLRVQVTGAGEPLSLEPRRVA